MPFAEVCFKSGRMRPVVIPDDAFESREACFEFLKQVRVGDKSVQRLESGRFLDMVLDWGEVESIKVTGFEEVEDERTD